MTEYKNLPIIVGGYGFQVEHFNGDSWDRKEDFPATMGIFIEFHTLVNFRDSVYLFGGR